MGKGVSREGESEGSPMQRQDVTNRNQIVGLSTEVREPEILTPKCLRNG